MLAELLIGAAFSAAALPERDCASHSEGPNTGLVTHKTDLVTPHVDFHGIRSWATRRPQPVPGGDAVAKVGLSVRAGAPVVLRIAPRDRDVVALDYIPSTWRRRNRTIADGFPAIRVRPCPRDRKRFSDDRPIGEWTGYNGGFLVARRACVTLIIERRDAPTLRRRVGFGRRCR